MLHLYYLQGIFEKNESKMLQQTLVTRSWKRLVESSNITVSVASEVPQSCDKLFFKEAQLLWSKYEWKLVQMNEILKIWTQFSFILALLVLDTSKT